MKWGENGGGSQCTHVEAAGKHLHLRVASRIPLLKREFYSIEYLKPTH